MTTLLSMTISASVIIAAIIVIRSLFIHRLPKRLFVILWTAAALRMLIPLSFSVNIPHEKTQSENTIVQEIKPSGAAEIPTGTNDAPDREIILKIVWAGGVIISLGIMTVLHVRSRRELSKALPFEDTKINARISAENLRRRITVKVSDRVTSPLTYGVINPVIILPKGLSADSEEMRFALSHELVHIRRFDVLLKITLTSAACVHWFNPLAWAMLPLANRDIELSCDEAVLKRLGCKREDYAMALIRLEERRSIPTGAAFGRNAVRERIEAIMKFKKTTLAGIIVSACLIAGTTTAFAAVNSDNSTHEENPATEAETAGNTNPESNDESDVEWWTYDEYKAWLEQEKQNIAELVKEGAAGWTQDRGDFIWTQEIADETIALYEQTLEDIKNGMYVSKSINGSTVDTIISNSSITVSGDPESGSISISEDITATYTENEVINENFSQYEQYGLEYNDGQLFYKGEPVKFFDDVTETDNGTSYIFCYVDTDGTVAVEAVREDADIENAVGDLTGVKALLDEEFANKKAEYDL